MIVLSLDLSLNCTGYAVIDTSRRVKKSRILTYGTIYNKHLDSKRTGQKLYHFELGLKSLLYGFNPQAIVVEALTGTGFTDSTQMAKVHGILEKLTMKFDNVHYINNKTFKAEFAGNGSAKKWEVAEAVNKILPDLVFHTDDESDAVGLGMYFTENEGMCTW